MMSRTPASFSASAWLTISGRVSWASPSVKTTSTRSAASVVAPRSSPPWASTALRLEPPELAMSGSSASRYIRIALPSTVSGARM